MSSSKSQPSVVKLRETSPELRLVNWPARDSPGEALLVLCCEVAIATLAGSMSRSLAMACLAFGVLLLVTWRLWIPIRFDLGPAGVTQTVLGWRRSIRWSDIAAYEPRARGILLVPHAGSRQLAAVRGLYVRWNKQKEQLLELVRYYRQPRRRTGSSVIFVERD